MRLLLLWLNLMPISMLAIAIIFAVVAVNTERWAMLAIMIVMALLATALFFTQRRIIDRYLTTK